MGELTKTGPSEMARVIEKIVVNPNVDVEKLQRILDMQEHILDRQAEEEFARAMARVEEKLEPILKDAKNEQTNSMYARLETIIKKIKPIYTSEGFSLSFYEGETNKPDHIRIMCDVMHSAGHTKTRYLDMPLDLTGIKGTVNKTMVHGKGSTITYGRRYLTCMIFNVATGDDTDGNTGAELITPDQAKLIKKMIEGKKINMERFLKYAKVSSIEEITQNKYPKILADLRAKR